MGRNEARVYEIIGHSPVFLSFLGKFEGPETSDTPSGQHTGDSTFGIVLEWCDYNLDQDFCKARPPLFEQDIIAFWGSMLSIVHAVRTLHNLYKCVDNGGGNEEQQRYSGWHGDIKPSNIFKAGDHWVLGDLGLANLLDRDLKIPPEPSITRYALSYGPPEGALQAEDKSTKMMQSADIWSLGCVFSLVATWIVLGKEGLANHRQVRITATEAIARTQIAADPDGLWVPGDFFHNGRDVLPEISSFHAALRKLARRSDNITMGILDIVDRGIFVQADQRTTAATICQQVEILLANHQSCNEDEFRDLREVMKAIDSPVPEPVPSSLPLLRDSGTAVIDHAIDASKTATNRRESTSQEEGTKSRSRKGSVSMGRMFDEIGDMLLQRPRAALERHRSQSRDRRQQLSKPEETPPAMVS
jgi:serine/threonine protein kinase